MKCNDFEILIDDYIEGTIAENQRIILEEHLRVCTNCNNVLEKNLIILEQVKSLPKEISPENDLWREINSRIKNKMFAEGSLKKSKVKNRKIILSYALPTLAAAMVLIAILYFTNVLNIQQTTSPTSPIKIDLGTYWEVTKVKGTPKSGDKVIKEIDSIKVGNWIETDDSSRALLKVAGIGSIIIEPGSKVRILKSDSSEQRIALEYGTIDANIDAKPRIFFVETKSAVAVDLGCSYTFSVDTKGDGLLFVKEGLVSLQSEKREALVPAGKFCITKEGFGPGTPYRQNTSPELKKALIDFDFKNGGERSVNVILKTAKKDDAVTLMNMIPRVEKTIQVKVYDRACRLSPPPRKIPEDSLPYLDFRHLNEWIKKIQKEVHENLEKSMKILDKEIQENIERSMKESFDNELLSKDLHEKINEGLRKAHEHMEKINDSINLDKEMEKVQKILERVNRELELNSEKIQREMERVHEELERANEKRERELEKMNEKLERDMEKHQRKLDRANEKLQRKIKKEIEKEMEKELEKEKHNGEEDTDIKLNEEEVEQPIAPEPEKIEENKTETPEPEIEQEKDK